jgi:SH3-like domain-containing protein
MLPAPDARHKNGAPVWVGKQAKPGMQAIRNILRLLRLAALALCLLALPGLAQDEGVSVSPLEFGPETNLPLPRYVSLKASTANVRRGPSLSHRIDWVFTRRDMPLQIIAEYGHWRRVIDREGQGGWVHFAMLSGSRTVLVEQDLLPLLVRPEADAPQAALLELGVIAELGDCTIDWCRLSAGGYAGWVLKSAIWGVDPGETRD